MPVISKTEYPVDGERFFKVIKCDRDGKFSLKLPESWTTIAGTSVLSASSKKDLERQWRETIDIVRSTQTSTRKVIAYQIQSSERDRGFTEGIGLSIYARVYIEHRRDTCETAYYDYKRVEHDDDLPDILWECTFGNDPQHGNRDDYIIVDWTPERHRFWMAVSQCMSDLIAKLKLLTDTRAVDALIASGAPLLPLPKHPASTKGERHDPHR